MEAADVGLAVPKAVFAYLNVSEGERVVPILVVAELVLFAAVAG